MSSVTEEDALADLVDLLETVTGITIEGDTEPVDARNGQAVVQLAGGTTTDYRFRVHIYSRGGHTGDVQTRLRRWRQDVEDALRTTAQFVMNEYTYREIDNTDAWVCVFDLVTGREDF